MKKIILLVILVSSFQLTVFSQESSTSKHNLIFGVNDLFQYNGFQGFITYGYNINQKYLARFSTEFGYYSNDIEHPEDAKGEIQTKYDYGFSCSLIRYLTKKTARLYSGIEVGITYSYSSNQFYDKKAVGHSYMYRASIPIGVEYSISKSVSIGIETQIEFDRSIDAIEAEDKYEDPKIYIADSLNAGEYKTFIKINL